MNSHARNPFLRFAVKALFATVVLGSKQRALKRQEVEKAYLVAKIEFDAIIRTTPTVVNGVLFVATEKTLYAIRGSQ